MTRIAALGLAAVVLSSCGSGGSSDGAALPMLGLAPDFSLRDDNPASATYGAYVSPRDHLGAITAWYFDEALRAAPT